jgi:DNA-binding HxlR family transcriptional regulator
MEPMESEVTTFCPQYHQAVELIGRRWTGAILRALMSGLTRFNELAAAIPGLSDRMLAERLKELESEGLLLRRVIPETPVRVEYRLTEKGRALEPVTRAVMAWVERWSEDQPSADGPVQEAASAGRP